MRAFLLLALCACGGSSVIEVPQPYDAGPLTVAELCSSGAGESPCAPGAVCIDVPGNLTVATCCTTDGGFAVMAFPDDLSPAECERVAARWSLICPPR